MKEKHLHIISFNVPYPPNYGGVIDVYYKIKALSRVGVKIHLHCFQYGREEAGKLMDYCEAVYYYPRQISLRAILSTLPFIVSSRHDKQLLINLAKNDYPILFEGLHTTFLLSHHSLKKSYKIVRTHNIEWQYYNHLAKLEQRWYKKLYFNVECKRLKKYEVILEHANQVISISRGDYDYYAGLFPGKTQFIPAFHQNDIVQILPGKGDYVLYHGDLSVKDNEAAAFFLIRKVFNNTGINFIIAGLNPGKHLILEIEKHPNISLYSNLSFKEMRKMIAEAHINLLYSFQSAGMKLKLLNALYCGRHCLVNEKMVENSELDTLCIIKNTNAEILQAVKQLMAIAFTTKDVQKRNTVLGQNFGNEINAIKLAELVPG